MSRFLFLLVILLLMNPASAEFNAQRFNSAFETWLTSSPPTELMTSGWFEHELIPNLGEAKSNPENVKTVQAALEKLSLSQLKAFFFALPKDSGLAFSDSLLKLINWGDAPRPRVVLHQVANVSEGLTIHEIEKLNSLHLSCEQCNSLSEAQLRQTVRNIQKYGFETPNWQFEASEFLRHQDTLGEQGSVEANNKALIRRTFIEIVEQEISRNVNDMDNPHLMELYKVEALRPSIFESANVGVLRDLWTSEDDPDKRDVIATILNKRLSDPTTRNKLSFDDLNYLRVGALSHALDIDSAIGDVVVEGAIPWAVGQGGSDRGYTEYLNDPEHVARFLFKAHPVKIWHAITGAYGDKILAPENKENVKERLLSALQSGDWADLMVMERMPNLLKHLPPDENPGFYVSIIEKCKSPSLIVYLNNLMRESKKVKPWVDALADRLSEIAAHGSSSNTLKDYGILAIRKLQEANASQSWGERNTRNLDMLVALREKFKPGAKPKDTLHGLHLALDTHESAHRFFNAVPGVAPIARLCARIIVGLKKGL